MRAKSSLLILVLSLALALGLTVACTRAANDAQIANQVQSKIATDTNIQTKQIGVQSTNGVVTLSGTVSNDMERAAAANDAAQVPGVKTVVNNLQVGTPAVAQETVPPGAGVEEPAPVQRRAEPRTARRAPARAREYSNTSTAPTGGVTAAAPKAAPARMVTVPSGSTLSVRLIDPIDSETNKVGDVFRATLSQPVMVGDEVVIPNDADIEGQVMDVKSSGHFTGQSAIALQLMRLSFNGRTYQLQTSQYAKQGTSRGKRTAATVGGGAGLGAIIGGIAGGGKGAAIGAAVGAGAGTGVQAATKGQQIKLPSETVLNFRLEGPLSVVPASASNRNAGRNPVE